MKTHMPAGPNPLPPLQDFTVKRHRLPMRSLDGSWHVDEPYNGRMQFYGPDGSGMLFVLGQTVTGLYSTAYRTLPQALRDLLSQHGFAVAV